MSREIGPLSSVWNEEFLGELRRHVAERALVFVQFEIHDRLARIAQINGLAWVDKRPDVWGSSLL